MQKKQPSLLKKYSLLSALGCSLICFTAETESAQPQAPELPITPLYFGMDIQKAINDLKTQGQSAADIIRFVISNIVVDQTIECVAKIDSPNANGGVELWRQSKQKSKNGLVTSPAELAYLTNFFVTTQSALSKFEEAKAQYTAKQKEAEKNPDVKVPEEPTRPPITSQIVELGNNKQFYQYNLFPLDSNNRYICYSRFTVKPNNDPNLPPSPVTPPKISDDEGFSSRDIEKYAEKYIKENPPTPGETQRYMVEYQKKLIEKHNIHQSVICISKATESLFFAFSSNASFASGFLEDPIGITAENTGTIPAKPNFKKYFEELATGQSKSIKYGQETGYYMLVPYPIDQNNVCFARTPYDPKKEKNS